MIARVPAYFDGFLQAIAKGARIEHVHLGHWDLGPAAERSAGRDDFESAQDRLAQELIRMADIAPGHRILDVGCGLGGVARIIDKSVSPIALVGVNIDPRQIKVCDAIVGRRANSVEWVVADACGLPFGDAVFDRLLCVEAIFHFDSRSLFFAEAYRVLRPGGLLVLSDILLSRPDGERGLSAALVETGLESDFGPWPEKWVSRDRLHTYAVQSGFEIRADVDATTNTSRSYRTIAPVVEARASGASIMRDMHEGGYLHYVYMALEKPDGP